MVPWNSKLKQIVSLYALWTSNSFYVDFFSFFHSRLFLHAFTLIHIHIQIHTHTHSSTKQNDFWCAFMNDLLDGNLSGQFNQCCGKYSIASRVWWWVHQFEYLMFWTGGAQFFFAYTKINFHTKSYSQTERETVI